MQKPRILFIITQSEFGGAQRFMFNLNTNIQDAYETMVLVGPDGGGEFIRALKTAGINGVELPTLRRALRGLEDLVCIRDIARTIREFAPDIVFLSSTKAGVLGTIAVNIRRLMGQKLFLLYRIGGWAFNDPRPEMERNAYAFVERLLSPSRDMIVQNSTADLDSARRRKIRPRLGFKIIHNGVDTGALKFFDKADARAFFRDKIGADLNAFDVVIGNTANYYKTKGLEHLISAMALIVPQTNAACILIGEGGERPALETLIKEKNLVGRVFLVGQVPDAYRYVKAYDIFALSSMKEGFPWAVLEAMAAGLPIVSTKVGAVPDIIEDGVSGRLVDPGQSSQLAEKIQAYINAPESMPTFGAAARARVEERFTLKKLLDNYKHVFECILQKRFHDITFD